MSMNLTDALNMLSKLTPLKAFNGLKVLGSYFVSRWTGKPKLRGLPISLSLEPTTSCNLRCPECPSGLRSFTRPTGMLGDDVFYSVIDQLSAHLFYLTFYFQGEPYLHPRFLEYVRYATGKGIYTATSTNAHFLDEKKAEDTVRSGLDRLIISLDGTTQETYEAYRVGGKLEKVLEGAKNVINKKKELRSKTPHVIFQFLVVKPNEHQLDQVRLLANETGVDEVVFKTAQIYDFENGSPLIPDNPRYSRYAPDGQGGYRIKNRLLNECWKMWQGCVITWDGRIVPCCFDKDASHVMGNVSELAFTDIWQGQSYNGFRKALLNGRDSIEMCRNCTEGTQVFA